LLRLKQAIKSLTLIPSGGGAFEVIVNGEKIYSKLATGQFPEPEAILKAIRARR
jgi:selenoprotein W-related protein